MNVKEIAFSHRAISSRLATEPLVGMAFTIIWLFGSSLDRLASAFASGKKAPPSPPENSDTVRFPSCAEGRVAAAYTSQSPATTTSKIAAHQAVQPGHTR